MFAIVETKNRIKYFAVKNRDQEYLLKKILEFEEEKNIKHIYFKQDDYENKLKERREQIKKSIKIYQNRFIKGEKTWKN